jgi:hypothetical protein
MTVLTHPARWAAALALVVIAAFAASAPALAAGERSTDQRFEYHAARLHARLDRCAASDPSGTALSKQPAHNDVSPRLAQLSVRVSGLRCAAGKVLVVVVVNDSGRHAVGRLRVNREGDGRATFTPSNTGGPLPRIHEGDTIVLYETNADVPVMGGVFQQVRPAAATSSGR